MKNKVTFIVLFITSIAFAQIDIKGTIYDELGNPLGGASILEKGTTNGVLSDFDGNFSIKVKNENSELVIAYLGYTEIRLTVGKERNFSLKMQPSTQNLDEIVVIGYGTVKKGDLTGSVSSIKPKDINIGTVSLDQALAGKSAGVVVTQSSGMPGAGAAIKIRGINSLNGSEPLYVIDGTPMDNSSINTLNSEDEASANISPLSMINPADIASVEILKDASATAIYGSRGANGVILITTKTGEVGKGVINVEHDYGIAELIRKLPLQDANEYWLTRSDANLNAGNLNQVQQTKIDSARVGLFRTTDWQDVVFRTGSTSNTDVNFSGGNKDVRYLMATNLFNAKGIIEKTDYTRISTRINLDANVSEKLKLGTRLYYANVSSSQQSTSTNFLNTGGLNSIIQRATRTAPFLDVNAISELDGVEVYTPKLALDGNDFDNKISQFLINTFLTYSFSKEISFKSLFSYQNRQTAQRFYQKNIFPLTFARRGWAKTSDIRVELMTNTNTFEFNKNFGAHRFNGVLGQSLEWFEFENLRTSNHGFANDLLLYFDPGSAEFYDPDIIQFSDSKLVSFFGRLNYNFRNKYLVTLTGRFDGSSKFAENNKWAFFPAVAVGYKVSQEKFLRNSKTISNLKVRLSYGLSGNQSIQPYQSLDQLGSDQYGFGSTNGETLATVYYNSQLPNANLKWETTAQFDAGIDFGFLKDRISGTIDYYTKRTKDLLFFNRIPAQSGFNNFTENFGELEGYGIEFSLSADAISNKRMTWNVSLNASTSKTKVANLAFDNVNSGYNQGWIAGGSQRLIIGEEVGVFYGYRTAGIAQFDDFVEFQGLSEQQKIDLYNQDRTATYTFINGYNGGLPRDISLNRPGEQLYTDTNNDGQIDAEDKVIIGNAQPDLNFGIKNSFTFGNFDLSIFIDGQLGQDIANVANFQLLAFDASQQLNTVRNAWTPENPSAIYPRLDANNIGANPFRFSDRFIEDGSFVRLQNVTLGYNFNKKVLEKLKLNQFQIFVSGTNLHIWTDYSGYNPDVSLTGSNTLSLGHDNGGYPISRIIRMGVKLRF